MYWHISYYVFEYFHKKAKKEDDTGRYLRGACTLHVPERKACKVCWVHQARRKELVMDQIMSPPPQFVILKYEPPTLKNVNIVGDRL